MCRYTIACGIHDVAPFLTTLAGVLHGMSGVWIAIAFWKHEATGYYLGGGALVIETLLALTLKLADHYVAEWHDIEKMEDLL